MTYKMYVLNVLAGMTKTDGDFASFGSKRKYKNKIYRHRGPDFKMTKGTDVKILFNGIVNSIDYNHKFHGIRITIKTSLKYLDENNSNILYHRYAHLWRVVTKTRNGVEYPLFFVKSGDVVAKSGNSGYVLTYDKIINKWRELTKDEVEDKNFKGGSHLHLEIFLKEENSEYTINDMKKVLSEFVLDVDYFYSKTVDGVNAIFINPDKMCKYFEIKQKEEKI